MKKSLVILLAIPTLVLTGCKNSKIDTSKIALDYGYYRNEQIHSWTEFEDLDYDNLDALMTTKESFVLLTYHNFGCDCWKDFAPLAVQFANEFHCDFRTLDVALLSGHSNKFGIYSGTDLMPGIVFIRRGKVIRQTIYGKVDENQRQMFKTYVWEKDSSKGFKPYMLKNVYLPNMYYIDKDVLDSKMENGDEFNLYVAKKTCPDCTEINRQLLYKWSNKHHNVEDKLYIFDIEQYQSDQEYYTIIKEQYGLSETVDNFPFGYGGGFVPTFQRRSGWTVTDMITVLNDSVSEVGGQFIINSYFDSVRVEASPMLNPTGDKYVFNGDIATSDMIEQIEYEGHIYTFFKRDAQYKLHKPTVELYLNTYVK